MASNNKDDKEFNDYLEGNSDLSNQYRASNTVESPAHLDEKILMTAKEAVTGSKQKSKVVFHKSPWALPVSIAAVITLSVSLVITMQQETGQTVISEPASELYDSAVLSEEALMPRTITVDDDMTVLDEVQLKLKQSSDQRMDVPEPAAFGAIDEFKANNKIGTEKNEAALGAVGGYRAESTAETLKNEPAFQPAKKALLQDKARSEASEKRVFAEEQLLQSAPAEAELDAVMELKRKRQLSQQDQELLAIKALWEEGDSINAKQAFDEFIKKYPDFTVESIKEILGANIYQALTSN